MNTVAQPSARPTLAEVQDRFPGLADKTFLDAACVGLAPVDAQVAIADFLDQVVLCDERDASTHHIALDAARGTAVVEAARLLGADGGEIALVESTTHGLGIAAGAIPFEPDDNVVICDLEFLEVAIPWTKLAERGAIREVRVARNHDGRVPVDAFAAVVDDRTRAVVVSSVQWTNRFAVDLDGLAGLCHAHGALLVVDAIQQLGATRLDVGETPVDLLVAGGHKWLNAPFGCGVLYVRSSVLQQLRMPSWGYLGLEKPSGGWGAYFADPASTPVRPYDFPVVAKSLELNGTANYIVNAGTVASNAARFQADRERIERAARVFLAESEKLAKSCKKTPPPVAKDTVRPTVRVQRQSGVAGTPVVFPFSVSDNSGKARRPDDLPRAEQGEGAVPQGLRDREDRPLYGEDQRAEPGHEPLVPHGDGRRGERGHRLQRARRPTLVRARSTRRRGR